MIGSRRTTAGRAALATITLIALVLGLRASLSQGDAHAGLDTSNPAADATLTIAPEFVEIYFTQDVAPTDLIVAVLDPGGTRIDNQDAAIDTCRSDRKRVVVTLPADLPDGEYIVQWQTVSAEDGEMDTGSYEFVLQAAGASPVASAMASPDASPAGSPTACP
jgi:methionine-rich copper-binding protein CopC